MKSEISFFFVLAILASFPARASCLDEAASYAEKICGQIEIEGRETNIKGKVQLNAKTNSILTKTVGAAGGSFQGDIVRKTYSGVVRSQLAKDRFDARNCKVSMQEVARKQICKDPEKQIKVDTITVTNAWYGQAGHSCGGILSRFVGSCNGKQSCKIQCDNSSSCGDAWKHHAKICFIEYRCGNNLPTSRTYPESSALGDLSCN